MIRPLRQRHRRTSIALGMFLPIVFVLGIVARKPVPRMDSLPANLAAMPEKFATTEWERADLLVKSHVKVRLLRASGNPGRFALEFSAPKDFIKPDLMVYWATGNSNTTDTLPNTAELLGAFNSFSPLALPADAFAQNGRLLLYSLADNEVVEVSRPFSILKP